MILLYMKQKNYFTLIINNIIASAATDCFFFVSKEIFCSMLDKILFKIILKLFYNDNVYVATGGFFLIRKKNETNYFIKHQSYRSGVYLESCFVICC